MALAVLISISAVGATFSHPIIGQSQTDQLCAVTLTDEIYGRLDGNYLNLAIINEDGQQIPAVLQRKQHYKIEEKKSFQRGDLVDFAIKNGTSSAQIELKEELQKNQKITGFSFKITQHDFENQVSVFGSKDGEKWKILAENQPIFDYSSHAIFSRKTVEIPPNSFSFFKFEFAKIDQKTKGRLTEIIREQEKGRDLSQKVRESFVDRPLKISAISAQITTNSRLYTDILREYPISSVKLETGKWGLSLKNQPIRKLEISANSENFIRKVALCESSTDLPIYTGTISRLQIGENSEEKTTIELPELHRFSVNLLQKENNLPCDDISKITAFGPEYQLIFLQRPGQSYKLVYGDSIDSSKSPDSALLNRLIAQKQPVAELTYGIHSPHKISALLFTKQLIFSETVLTILLVLGITVLALYLIKNVKKLDVTEQN